MHDIQQTLAVATEHHRAGRTAEAERLYREVLAAAPGQADALHLLGVLALQSGRPADAADLIAQAVAADAGSALFNANLGHALHAVGRQREAALSFAHALTLLCNAGEGWGNIGALANLIRRYDPDTRRAAADEVDRDYALGDVMRRRSLLFHLDGDLRHYRDLVAAVLAEPEGFTVPSLHYAYWGMQFQLYRGEAVEGDAGAFTRHELREMHRLLVEQTALRYGVTMHLRRVAPRDPVRRIALITNQVLGADHAPSVTVLDLSRRLQDEHGCEVLVVNANAMAVAPENGFVPEFAYNMAEGFDGVQSVAIGDGRVRMVSATDRHFDAGKVGALVDHIAGFDPDAVVAFGASNVIADLFAATRPVVCVPTTAGYAPSLARLVLGHAEVDSPDDWPVDDRPRFRPYGYPAGGAGADAAERLLDYCREAQSA